MVIRVVSSRGPQVMWLSLSPERHFPCREIGGSCFRASSYGIEVSFVADKTTQNGKDLDYVRLYGLGYGAVCRRVEATEEIRAQGCKAGCVVI